MWSGNVVGFGLGTTGQGCLWSSSVVPNLVASGSGPDPGLILPLVKSSTPLAILTR